VFIVLLGLVRVDVERPGGRIERRFVGVGGSVGIVPSIVRRDVPGFGLVAAYGQVSCDAFSVVTLLLLESQSCSNLCRACDPAASA
jgi:hypothetical protein